MTHTDMGKKERGRPSRIPVRFVDGEDGQAQGAADEQPAQNDSGLTPEDLGRESSYEDATEMERRINRGDEQPDEAGRQDADDKDVAGTLDTNELPRSRNDQDTTPSHDAERKSEGGVEAAPKAQGVQQQQAETASGPVLAELVATRSELRRVEAQLKRLSDERQEWADRLARRQAEFENFRKRTERERSETYNRALGEVVRRLLPVLDNLQRALDAERAVAKKGEEEFRHFISGVELINRQLGGVLEGLGVEAVPTVGTLFDPHVHEAVATEETAEAEPDTILQEMQRGYRLGDKLLRPAMVKVATKA